MINLDKKLLIVAGVMIVIFVAMLAGNPYRSEKKESEKALIAEKELAQTENQKLDNNEKVLQFIQNYRGEDNSGPTFNEVFDGLLAVAYPNENIMENPSTTGYFIASEDYSREISDRYWRVELEIQTYRERIHYEWIVDAQTSKVFAANEMGQSFLDILDNFD